MRVTEGNRTAEPESQVQNMSLTVLNVPFLLDNGAGEVSAYRGSPDERDRCAKYF
jgi:hypothetical protein